MTAPKLKAISSKEILRSSTLNGISFGLTRKLPVILQTEAAECGLACLAMISNFFGRQIDLSTLRRRHPVSLKGTRLSSLIDVANRLGLEARAVRLELDGLGNLRLPCILHWRFDHFVVLRKIGRGGISIHDPGKGPRSVRLSEVSECFTGVALELWPQPDFPQENERTRVRVRDLVGKVTGLFPAVTQLVLLALVIELLAVASPLALQWVVDHVLVSGNRSLLVTLVVGFGLLVVLQQTISLFRSWALMYFSTNLSVQWRANTFAHLLRLPLEYFQKRHLGDIISRFRSIDVIQRTLSTAFLTALLDGLMSVVVLTIMLFYSLPLTTVSILAVSSYLLIRAAAYRPLRLATKEHLIAAANQESHFLESVRGAPSIKLFQRERERHAHWLSLMVKQINADLRTQKLGMLCQYANGLIFGIEGIAVIGVGALLVLDGALSVGMLMAFLSYKGQFSSRFGALIDRVLQVKMLSVQGERLADIVLTKPENPGAGDRLSLADQTDPEPTVSLQSVSFRYGEHEPFVLEDVDLEIRAGESVAIVGPSGCGKTTLLHLILGALRPTHGRILIGGIDVSRVHPETIRAIVGSVTQGDTLFAGSIADNICFFDSQADQKRIEQSAKLASIHKEIIEMPMGYNTLIGHMGSALSGGQYQRVLLARALYKQPKVLVLDEATSHLDLRREAMVNSSVSTLSITRIIVAHRPQTAESTDRIITLESGRIVEERRTFPNLADLREKENFERVGS